MLHEGFTHKEGRRIDRSNIELTTQKQRWKSSVRKVHTISPLKTTENIIANVMYLK